MPIAVMRYGIFIVILFYQGTLVFSMTDEQATDSA